MGATHFTGPVLSGDLQQGQPNGPNQGFAVLEQDIDLLNTGAGNADYPIYLPAGSIILDFIVDVLTEWNSATSATLLIGNTVGGSQYLSAVDIHAGTAGRQALAQTAAQLAAMAGQTVLGVAAPLLPLVNIRVAAVGAGNVGAAHVTVRYAQQTSSN